jgi:hypothetical protein
MQTVTYVCARPGSVTLPALVIPWWDVAHQTLMRVTLPALALEVVAPSPWLPGWASWVAVGGVFVLVIAGVGCYKRRAPLGVWKCWQTRHQARETGIFAQLQKACRAGDAVAAYNMLLCWLDYTHRGPGSATLADDLVAHYPDTHLRQQVETLQEAVLHRDMSWNGAVLAEALHQTRQAHRRRTTAGKGQLPALNPR